MNVRGIELTGAWTNEELKALKGLLEPLPAAWVENNTGFRRLDRKPTMKVAPPSAPGHSKYEPGKRTIVVYDKGVYHAVSKRIDREQFPRSVYHELAHSLLLSSPGLIKEWVSQTANDGFVDEYAKTNAHEDFADSFSEFFINPERTKSVAPRKYKFIRDRLHRAQEEKVAMPIMESFNDELIKCALAGIPRAIMRTAGSMPRGLKLSLVGAGGAGAYVHGKRKGARQGRAEGARATKVVAQRAYQMGVRSGAVAMRAHILTRMRSMMGSSGSGSKK